MPSISGGGMTLDLGIVLTERTDYTGTVTSAPIEGGASVNDHYIFEPPVINLTGVVSSGAGTLKSGLEQCMDEGALCRYSGRNIMSSVVITRFSPTFNSSNANGFSYNISLRYVRLSTAQKFSYSTGLSAAASASASNSTQNRGTTSPTTVKKDSVSVSTSTAAANSSASIFRA